MNANATKTVATVALIALAAVASGCATASRPMAPPRSAGDLAFRVPADAVDGPVEVVVTGSDMAQPVRSRLQVEGSVAQGTVYDLTEGENRRVLLTARTADGRRCAVELDAAVAGRTTTDLEVEGLRCEARHQAPARAIARSDHDAFPPIL